MKSVTGYSQCLKTSIPAAASAAETHIAEGAIFVWWWTLQCANNTAGIRKQKYQTEEATDFIFKEAVKEHSTQTAPPGLECW